MPRGWFHVCLDGHYSLQKTACWLLWGSLGVPGSLAGPSGKRERSPFSSEGFLHSLIIIHAFIHSFLHSFYQAFGQEGALTIFLTGSEID